MNMFWWVVVVTAIAGVGGTGLGGLIGVILRRDSSRIVSLLLAFAGGVMMSVVCFDLIPGAFLPEGATEEIDNLSGLYVPLTEAVRRRPYCVLLFDEVEKAHPDVLNVLLQVLDDGRITDGQGRTVDFKNTIIILTSNIGSDLILNGMEHDGSISAETEEKLHKLLKAQFRPEFLNRLDEIVFFRALTNENMLGIVELLIKDLARRMKNNDLELVVTDSAKQAIITEGADPLFGARPLKRFIQGRIESLIARFIIENTPSEGSTIKVDHDSNGFTVSMA